MPTSWAFDDDGLTSSPRSQRPRGIKRGKGDEEGASDGGKRELENVESDLEDDDDGNMALGSSCITSGTESDDEENDNKKPRLDEVNILSMELVDQEVTDNASVARDTRKEDTVMSSVAAGAITPLESSMGEEGQE